MSAIKTKPTTITAEKLTEVMKNTVADILSCYDYGEDGWDEDLIAELKRRIKKGKPDWARQWYLNQIKSDGSFGFSNIGAGFWFAEWLAKEGLKLVDWVAITQYIIAITKIQP